jgi:hypothetical protein
MDEPISDPLVRLIQASVDLDGGAVRCIHPHPSGCRYTIRTVSSAVQHAR